MYICIFVHTVLRTIVIASGLRWPLIFKYGPKESTCVIKSRLHSPLLEVTAVVLPPFVSSEGDDVATVVAVPADDDVAAVAALFKPWEVLILFAVSGGGGVWWGERCKVLTSVRFQLKLVLLLVVLFLERSQSIR